ncbi:endonuclease III [Candidatus Kinetoplastidibacterium crithidiae]|uniref:Endonuclease III n=1 Tax=Candidatus Kinetoplastidibacterium crithidiae TCC036E TaxID=1208918 RepID=M1LUJ5_9PROT|nr:endonuclease III [Candidatus Kinetoplastibacterium crithidii]AFZ82577.1 endonuclease III [Candidatus Kinetoplastibacterium crithidii (ex Angomonas deanei ATCC 30255)]AGF47761.1 endonuclease III [Candidatus Kinetoplastibacterium crithidii TCC036E]
MEKEKIISIFERFQNTTPNPKTELEYNSAFQLLVAVILSAQSTDKSVNAATKHLFLNYGTPKSLIKLGVSGIESYIKSIGLYKSKSKNIFNTSTIIDECFNGQVPGNRKDLELLPGVGRKTANIILNIIFQQPTVAVDTHVFRVSNRTGLAKGENVVEVEKNLLNNIPKEYLQNAHHWLIILGRYTCKKKSPKCHLCLIKDICEYDKKSNINIMHVSKSLKKQS